jgi:hypothetical protein
MTDAAFGQTWAQLLDAEQALRALAEGQVREYVGVLEQLAHSLVPAETDARKRGDPAYFRRLTAAEWLAFFGAATRGRAPATGASWALGQDEPAHARVDPEELGRLRRDLAVVQAENNRLRDLVQQLRQEKAALAAAKEQGVKPAPAGARPAPEAPTARQEVATTPASKPPAGLPEQPPAKYANVFSNWPADGLALATLAQTGWSLRQAIMRRIAQQLGVSEKDKELRVLFSGLENRRLVQQHVEVVDGTVTADSTTGQVRIGIVRLGELAGRVLAELGIQPVLSEWERLEARDGPDQVKRIAWVCAFADHARQRGYTVEVCPQTDRPARSDLFLVKGDERAHMVVRGAELATPWAELIDGNGAVVLGAPTRQVRQHLVAAAKTAGIVHGRATDLELLLSGGDRGALWAESW